MKHLMTLMALVVAVTAGAQGTTIHEYPWNPDFNNDTYIGSEDLMGLLSTYGTQFGLPPEPCDYDGTPLEELAIGIADGTIILDSLFIEYELESESTYYVLGCPDTVTDSLIFSNSAMISSTAFSNHDWTIYGPDSYGNDMNLNFFWNLTNGNYVWSLNSSSLGALGFVDDGFFSGNYIASYGQIPFNEDWYLDENGIHINFYGDWSENVNYLHILPYWHYAE
jgi:hypothetical protein